MQPLRPEDLAQAPGALTKIRLADYQPPAWLIDSVDLTFSLHPTATRVIAKLAFRRNPARAGDAEPADLRLDGRKLTLVSAAIDGETLPETAYAVDAEGITVAADALPDGPFVWRCETEINPRENTALEGLYMSRDMFCSQCEAEGFRKITYYLDRPDVMSVFSVRIEADKSAFPVLLSNGNRTGAGDLTEGRHFAEWCDPHPKPCYLFALVAGDLVAIEDRFATASGRDVTLQIFTRRGDETKSAYAMDALKRSMRWDEEAYGREYDLDLFMIVAVDDFNMGAMENKGLNIFNSKYILASPETATDRDYELIESVVAHEYFHNWTGNRITCRDWFQLCLKEGLTVFRDQQFSEHERSAAVTRIDEVRTLRARQFREDAGPLAHPVRPEEYVEINNFYTATVYEKGAEIVRLLHTLVGPETYRKALDLYFERHDGQACTIEDFRQCFEDASGRDLSQFALWWGQAGTPRVTVEERFEAGVYELTLSQQTPPTPGQDEKAPLVIPIAYGLLGPDGQELDAAGGIVELDGESQSIRVEGVQEKPALSINRGFSAPIIVERSMTEAERAFLLAHDSDPFNRWEAGRGFAIDTILGRSQALQDGEAPPPAEDFLAAMGASLTDESLDPAFRALVWSLPGEDELAQATADSGRAADPDAIHAARTDLQVALARAHEAELRRLYDAMATPGPYSPDAQSAGKRALRNVALSYLGRLGTASAADLVETQFRDADNMTDQLPALTVLTHTGAGAADRALEAFYDRWRGDSLVLGKWFGVQATSPQPDALDRVAALTDHPAFEWKNPNKFRALLGAFAMANPVGFHRADGAGYRFFTDWLIRLDPVNPQTTAKLTGAFESWRRYDAGRQAKMRAELERIKAVEGLSKDTGEMVTRLLGA